MARRLVSLRIEDILQAIERARHVVSGTSLDAFENDWEKRWLIERAIEIVSEASRHLGEDVRTNQSAIPWKKIAGIGNVLRHGYDQIAPDVLWNVVHTQFASLEAACRSELPRIQALEEAEKD
jgi:uncharacterized protein with HEPN domain